MARPTETTPRPDMDLYLSTVTPDVLAPPPTGGGPSVGEGPVTPACIEGLSYVRMVLQEAMRLFPPVWLCHGAASGTRRWTVTCAGWHARRRQSLYAAPSPGLLAAAVAVRPRPVRSAPAGSGVVHLLPLQRGPRSCIGRSFAMVETVVVLAAIVRRFDLRTYPGHPVRCEALVTRGRRAACQ